MPVAVVDRNDGPPRRGRPPVFPNAPDALEGVGVEDRYEDPGLLYAPFEDLRGDVREVAAVEEDLESRALADVRHPHRSVLGRVEALAVRHEDVIHRVVRQGLRIVELRGPRPERRRGAVLARLVDRGAAPAQRQARRARECRCLEPRRTSGGERGQPAGEADGPVEDVERGLRAEPLQRYQRLGNELGRDHLLPLPCLPGKGCNRAAKSNAKNEKTRTRLEQIR